MKRNRRPQDVRPRNHYRLILQEEVTFEEKWALRVKPGQLRWLALASVLAIIGLTYAFTALTPAREWIVPGYLSTETRKMQVEAWEMTDSLSRELQRQQRYIENMMAVLEGRVIPDESTVQTPTEKTGANSDTEPTYSPSLDRLRDDVAQEDAFSIGRTGGLQHAGVWQSPVDGRISAPWDPTLGHWGVDLVAPEDSPVKAVGGGTVVFSGFTANGGHTVILQHEGSKLTTYMHNSRIEVKPGDRVQAGDVIAIIGNSGDHSTGPHLHFEWWEGGVPIDPTLRLNL
jgi:murein DD-endopeptidase MepM/ murein hydrolase activator NlpD